MEQSFSKLLGDALSDLSDPLFPDGDLDFENLNFNVKFEEDEADIADRQTDTALHQEGNGGTAVLCSTDSEDINRGERVDEDHFEDKKDAQGGRCPTEDDYTSSDEDCERICFESGGDEEEDMGTGDTPGDLLMSVCCSDEFGHEEDRTSAEGLPSAPEGAAVPQVGKVEQGDNESDEEVSYFERVPESGKEIMPKSDCESESMRLTQDENADSPEGGEPATATLEFQDISVQNLQDVIAEVDGEEYAERIQDFSGEEHEEAGESFADYPSDFSSCENLDDGVLHLESDSQSSPSSLTSNTCSNAKQSVRVEGAVMDITWMGTEEDSDEQGGRYLYRRDLETGADVFKSCDVEVTAETEYVGNVSAESESYSSSDDEVQERRREEEPENHNSEGSTDFSRWSISDDHRVLNSEAKPADFSTNSDSEVLKTAYVLSEDLITAEDTERAERALSHVSQRPAEEINTSVIEREESKSISPSYQGSLDDGFFFNTDVQALGITELGQLGDGDDDEDDYYDDDEERSWEQERIKAFFRFYNHSEREERQIKVQFCADHLSQVIHYETDSDSDSLSSSTGGEDDPCSAEASEELKEAGDILPSIPASHPPATQLQQSEPGKDVSHRQICGRRHKCLSTLKSILKIGLVIVTGVLMFWLAADQTDWLFIWD